VRPGSLPGAVLFDLDGTLLDTAPDMVAALRNLQAEEGRAPVPFATARAWVSNGTNGMLRVGFGTLDEPVRARLHARFLDIYAECLAVDTRLFAGMDEVLAVLEDARVPWGVVTNKPARLTEPLLEALGLRARCACVVSGDTTPHRKPRPEPVLHALAAIPATPAAAVYVGDAERDIAAGRGAGTRTVAALYGYIPPGDDPDTWGSDHRIAAPSELLGILSGRREPS
jgi:phosphoglycolate phosphatase